MTNGRKTSWRRRLLWYGIPALLVIFAANHAEYWLRQKRAKEREDIARTLSVRSESSLFAGHRTIGIEEKETSGAGPLFLRFAVLGQWSFDPKSPSPCPKAVQDLSGRDASCIGFMYPLEAGTELKTFCLLRTTQTCCYGPRPQYSQYLLVEMKTPVKFERLTPVIVRGKFIPDAQPKEGFIYRMEGTSVMPVMEEPDVNPTEAARKADLPLFDFAPLAAMETEKSDAVPAELQALNGKQVMVAGFLQDRVEGPSPQILVGKEYWDGISRGKPPTFYTAVMVLPRDPSQVPPLWKEKGAFTGVLHVETNPADWSKAGIVSLRDASRYLGSSLSVGGGPLLPPLCEILMLVAVLCLGLLGRHKEEHPS